MPETASYNIGSIVRARGREWIVLPGSTEEELHLRPMSGSASEETLLLPDLERERPAPASFGLPDPALAGSCTQANLLRDALRFKLRNGAGPFRSFGNIAVQPRSYQLVPLLMALRQPVTRLLVADDVGVGKTIEAGLILRELLDRGEISRAAVLCPPHLVEQWQGELLDRFHISAVALTSRTAVRIERDVPAGESLFSHFPFVIVSLDYIKQERRRDNFLATAPEFIIVDEAHTCTQLGTGVQHRWKLLQALAQDTSRHLVLLTATPHSGNETAFYNLLSLLDPEFAGFATATESAFSKLRKKLARSFVQRRRADIEKYWGGEHIFPNRMIAEETYILPTAWQAFYQKILTYCRDLTTRGEEAGMHRAMVWYSTLALLRCASSSPAAAVRAFDRAETRAGEGADVPDTARVTDDPDAESPESDFEPDLLDIPAGHEMNQLRELAQKLMNDGSDPKLAKLTRSVRKLVDDGFHPVVFCRYVATAHYVADHLQKKLKGVSVRAVTGEMPSDDRETCVAELAEENERHVLVCTDCLSEGINLQEAFDAVVHYDLSWNPTRHEQREGRVDRYGQPAPEVRCLLLYGQDNPVDGLVLKVIIHKASAIKDDLGVVVPVPTDGRRLDEAMMRAILFKGIDDPNQMTFIENLDFGSRELEELDVHWRNAAEREKATRRVFAQQSLKPDEVLPELRHVDEVLGTPEDVRRFTTDALASLNAPLSPLPGHPDAFSFMPESLPDVLRERLRNDGLLHRNRHFRLTFDQNRALSNVTAIHRTHPLVSALADYVVETALSPALAPDGTLKASRCAVMATRDVSHKTILLLLRLRHRLTTHTGNGEKAVIAEELLTVAAESPSAPRWLVPDAIDALYRAEPAENLTGDTVRRALLSAFDFVRSQGAFLEDQAVRRADALLADHRRVRDASDARGSYSVTAVLPVDVLGVYVFLPSI